MSNWKAARRNSKVESIPMIDDSENLKTFNIKSCESDRNEKTVLKTTEEEEKYKSEGFLETERGLMEMN